MELQLGLAISSRVMKEFDLNCYGEAMEVSCLSGESIGEFGGGGGDDHHCISKKRNFGEAFDQQQQQGEEVRVLARKTLPLLLSWDNSQPNEDDDPTDPDDNNSSTINKSYGEEDGVVGWPPIKSWRKKLCQQNNIYGGGGGANSTFVKVKMEGVVIARKVDLSLHHSYQELKDTLVDMFGRGQENVEAYELTYQDREGDWLLAGDVPWCSFIQSVQRLKLLRSME